MSQVNLDAFLLDAKTSSNQKYKEKSSSLRPLTDWLRLQVANPQATTTATLVAMVQADRKHLKYVGAIRRLASVWGTGAPYPSGLVEERFCVAYHRALYWHGVKRDHVIPSILSTGLQTQYGACKLGAKEPGSAPLPGGGPISLGLSKIISEAYIMGDSHCMFRVFPPAARGRHGVDAELAAFRKGERRLYNDVANPGAVLLQEDLEPEYILHGTHTAVVIGQATSLRSKTILEAIGGYDTRVPQDAAQLIPYLKLAIESGRVGDRWEDEPKVAKTSGANADYWQKS